MNDEKHPDGPLAPRERKRVREMLVWFEDHLMQQAHREWLRRQAKWWTVWLLGVPTSLWAAYEASAKLLAVMSQMIRYIIR